MPVKVIVSKGKPIDQFILTKDVSSIGRKSDCDISIKDPSVSGHHARVQKVGNNYLIQDLDSTNGVHVRGRRIKQHVLKNEDVVNIGEHSLKFMITGSPESKSEVKKVATDTATTPVATPAPTILPPDQSPKLLLEDGKAHLKVMSGGDAGRTITLEEGLTTIGLPGIQVAAVSRRPQGHFIIHVDGGKDKDKVPMVNGEPTGFKSRKLEDGDKIKVAGIEMEYRVD